MFLADRLCDPTKHVKLSVRTKRSTYSTSWSTSISGLSIVPDVKMGGLGKSQQKINKSHLMPYSVSRSGIAVADWTSDSLSGTSSCSKAIATGELCTISISIQMQKARRKGTHGGQRAFQVPLQTTDIS